METLTVKQVHERMGGSLSSIYHKVKKGEFPGAFKDETGHWLIPKESVPKRVFGMTVTEAARYYGVSRQTIYNRCDSGDLFFDVDHIGKIRIPRNQ